jgi:hypothetical protein
MNDIAHPTDYERTDADSALIGSLALSIAAFLIATPFVLMAVYPGADRLGGVPANLPSPPAPRLQVHPKDDLDRLRAAEQVQLTTFGWVDRDRRIARMPIEHAMQLLAERGVDGWRPPSTPKPSTR